MKLNVTEGTATHVSVIRVLAGETKLCSTTGSKCIIDHMRCLSLIFINKYYIFLFARGVQCTYIGAR